MRRPTIWDVRFTLWIEKHSLFFTLSKVGCEARKCFSIHKRNHISNGWSITSHLEQMCRWCSLAKEGQWSFLCAMSTMYCSWVNLNKVLCQAISTLASSNAYVFSGMCLLMKTKEKKQIVKWSKWVQKGNAQDCWCFLLFTTAKNNRWEVQKIEISCAAKA